jgi:G3E family GTPase
MSTHNPKSTTEEPPLAGPSEVILITGFLGAGKTTLLRHILQWPGGLSSTAVLVNEFGQVGIDGELLKGFQTPVVELTNGCICCSMQGDMVKSLEEITEKFHPRRILIEATGVADPLQVNSFLKTSRLEGRIGVPKVVTVLDADIWKGREYFGPVFFNQIKAAQILLFNKVDLLPKEDVGRDMEQIREVNPSCSILPTHHCQIDPEVIWSSLEPKVNPLDSFFLVAPSHQESAVELGYVAFSFEDERAFDGTLFRRFIAEMPLSLYRMKGFVSMDGKCLAVNYVGGKTEWTESNVARPTKLAFVGWQVDESEVIYQLRACIASRIAGLNDGPKKGGESLRSDPSHSEGRFCS